MNIRTNAYVLSVIQIDTLHLQNRILGYLDKESMKRLSLNFKRFLAASVLVLVCSSTYAGDKGQDEVAVEATEENQVQHEYGGEPQNWRPADRGKYMVELLGCGSCHTNGAIIGEPDSETLLSGSDIGIAFSTPLLHRDPGIVYPPNITPDIETGIGGWTAAQIVNAIRDGKNLHGLRQGQVMPWEGYAILTNDDAFAIAAYLQSIPAVNHRVPANVREGEQATDPYIYLGVYQQD